MHCTNFLFKSSKSSFIRLTFRNTIHSKCWLQTSKFFWTELFKLYQIFISSLKSYWSTFHYILSSLFKIYSIHHNQQDHYKITVKSVNSQPGTKAHSNLWNNLFKENLTRYLQMYLHISTTASSRDSFDIY